MNESNSLRGYLKRFVSPMTSPILKPSPLLAPPPGIAVDVIKN